MASAGMGINGGYTGNSKAVFLALGSFVGITWYNCMELLVLIFITFHQYKGLYFWSLLIATVVGVLPHSIGHFITDFNLATATWLPITISTVGWWAMVTGQSFVLYSRLNIVLFNPRALRLVLYMIFANTLLLMVPTTILTYASYFSGSNKFDNAFSVYEKIQIVGFSIQEIIISGLYIQATRHMIKLNPEGEGRKIVIQLFIINFAFIIMDLALIGLESANLYTYQTTFKGLVYSIKLKLEFAVLGKLVHIANPHDRKPESSHLGRTSEGPSEVADFVDATHLTSDVTHATGPAVRTYRPPPHMRPEDVSIAMFEHSDHRDVLDDTSPEVEPEDDLSSSVSGNSIVTPTQFPVDSASSPRAPS